MANYLTYKEAAARFGKSEWTIISWARAGLIRKYRRRLDRRNYVDVREIEALHAELPTEIGTPAEDSEEFRQV